MYARDSDPTSVSSVPPLLGEPALTPYVRWAKPLFDFVLGFFLLLLTLPLMLLIGLVVRANLGKCVIYKQTRVGRGGVPFTMYKFRTMLPDRRQDCRPFVAPDRRQCPKRDDDPRHTRLGRFLRSTSLDELPQFWNVLRGEMSLVGPRPELPVVVAQYEPWQHERHEVKPGVTGFWQTSDRVGNLAHEGVDLDLQYLREISFMTDCRVIVRTVVALMRRTGR